MSENGLWAIEFISTINLVGTGVLVLNDGRLLGGDEGFYYAGTYHITPPNEISAQLNVTRFNPNNISVFGDIDQFTLNFKGTVKDQDFEGIGTTTFNPTLKIRIRGKKKEDL